MINKNMTISGITTLVGIALLFYTRWQLSQPLSRDPDIGTGILFLFGIGVVACGTIWFIVELVMVMRRR